MANPNRLRIIYHPARRAISFFLYEDDKKIDARYESLEKYSVYEKGKFVLSLCGNSFFTDILKPFVGKDFVNISLRTTKIDYEDFKRRVCEYNATKSKNDCEIKLLPLDEGDELLDMKQSFYEIKGQGEKIVSLLNEHWKKIQDIHCTSANAKEYLMRVAEKIKIEKDSIEKNLKALSDDNNVNLCLIGVHSSGKSTLINTLLGYRILPVDIRPETAKMLKITGVDLLEDSYIKFSIGKQDDEKKCHIKWDKNSNSLCIKDSNLPQEQKNLVVDELKKNSDSQIHDQFYRLLDYLNRDESLNARIDLGFPIPFNSPDLKFTIYDTPGADSNVGYHKKILSEALANQTNSILLFVLLPNSLSGTGNVEIMKELLEKSKNSNNVIDIEQSFFVFNWADSCPAELDKLKDGKLKKFERDENPVDLSDRKVFFVSAKCGFAAMATKNNVAGSDEKDTFEFDCDKSYRSSNGRYYKHNHFGNSEYATKLMIENTEVALQNAENANDDCMKYLISSGIFTLQEEIKNYGERYASAVKTSAIIKSIESAAESVTRMVKETSLGTDEKVKDIQTKLENEINKVGEIIDATSVEYARRSKTPSEIDKVGIGAQSFHYNVLTPVVEVLNKKLEKFLLLCNVHINDQMQTAIQTEISEIYRTYTENYKDKREAYLVRTQAEFINDFMNKVEKSEISQETKKKLKDFKLPDTPEFGLDKKIDELFDGAKLFEHENIKKFFKAIADGTSSASEKLEQSINKNETNKSLPIEKKTVLPVSSSKKDKAIAFVRNLAKKTGDSVKDTYEKSKKKLIHPVIKTTAKGAETLSGKIDDWETRTVSKKQFITDVKDWFQKNQGKLTDKFIEDFSTAIDQMCKDLVDEFKGNIETYSTKIRALREDNEPLEILAADIVDLQQAVSIRKEELESKI